MVSKPNGSPRICFDARELNKVTKKDAYPVSQAAECLTRMKGAVLFSTGDALSGFWQIAVRKEDEMLHLLQHMFWLLFPFGRLHTSQ